MDKQRVLFFSPGHGVRSRAAAAILRAVGGDLFEASSAAPRPPSSETVEALREAGIDEASAPPAAAVPPGAPPFDYVIALCDGETEPCGDLPAARETMRWRFPGPPDRAAPPAHRAAALRRSREELTRRLRIFVELERRRLREDRRAGAPSPR